MFSVVRKQKHTSDDRRAQIDMSVVEPVHFVRQQLVDPNIFWLIWQLQGEDDKKLAPWSYNSNLRTLKNLAACRVVCRAWRSMIDSWKGQQGLIAQFPSGEDTGLVGEHPVFGRYRRNAEEFILGLDNYMKTRWRILDMPSHWSFADRMSRVKVNLHLAVVHLANAFDEHGLHKAAVQACVAELGDIVAYTNTRFYVSEFIVCEGIWPLFRVLQYHHGDTSIGMLILRAVLQIVRMHSSIPFSTTVTTMLVNQNRIGAADSLVRAFLRSCQTNKELEDTVGSVLFNWFESRVSIEN